MENRPDPMEFETVEPIGKRVLIRKDEDKKQTKGGIQLPDNIEIPTITGRIVAVSAEIENLPEIFSDEEMVPLLLATLWSSHINAIPK